MTDIRKIFTTAQNGTVIVAALVALMLSLLNPQGALAADNWTTPSPEKVRAQLMAKKAALHFANRDAKYAHQPQVVRVKAQAGQLQQR